MDSDKRILIAGGGIGGLAAALALAKRGLASTVLERRIEPAEAGAGIQIGPNGVRALQRLGVAAALRPLVGVPEAVAVMEGASGRVLARLPLGSWIAERHGAPYWVAHRADLHTALLAAASTSGGVSGIPGFDLLALTHTDSEVRATSSAGEIVSGPALIGADGLWSSVRTTLFPAAAPRFAGATAARAVIAAAHAGRLAEPVVGLWLSPRAHVVHYPVRGGAEIAVVVIAAEPWQERDWDTEADPADVLACVARFHTSLTDVLADVPAWRKWGLFSLPPLPRWSHGRVTLLGDAAHPMLPYLAQGGVLALEDALVLADCLAAGTAEVDAFRAYEKLRRRRAARVQAVSRRQGRLYHLQPPLSWARNTALRTTPAAWLMAGFDWLYGWEAKTIAR
jgi:salicylate hydroxylase